MSARSKRPVRVGVLAGGRLASGDPQRRVDPRSLDSDAVYPPNRQETLPVALMALTAGFLALAVSAKQGYMMLYGDAVAHLGIARRIVDNNAPGLVQLGSPWLPLPHLLMLPFIGKMEWWRDGMAGAWPSLICYVLGVVGVYRLARRLMSTQWSFVAAGFIGLNANLLYLSTTAMNEPLFLALLVWITLVVCEVIEFAEAGLEKRVAPHLVLLGLLILAAVMTRYDGWIVGAVAWCMVTWRLWREPALWRKVRPGYVLFSLLTVAGPAAWFEYNHVYGHDWLDFMRGPYSAKEIDRKTSPPGSHHYFGWHDPAWSLMLYARTAQVDAAAWETGWLVAAAALWGLWKLWKAKVDRASLLLWVPLPFYVYSVSYGSVPIFIPQIYPHSFYNSRYGVEMLAAFAIFMAYGLYRWALEVKVRQPLVERVMQPVMLALVVLNLVFMLHAIPLVLKEGMINSQERRAIEMPLAEQLILLPKGEPLLMDTSEYIGALQIAEVPLKQTITPSDYYRWKAALADPAHSAAMIIATDGDAVSKALIDRGGGLTQVSVLHISVLQGAAKPDVHVYRSNVYGGSH